MGADVTEILDNLCWAWFLAVVSPAFFIGATVLPTSQKLGGILRDGLTFLTGSAACASSATAGSLFALLPLLLAILGDARFPRNLPGYPR